MQTKSAPKQHWRKYDANRKTLKASQYWGHFEKFFGFLVDAHDFAINDNYAGAEANRQKKGRKFDYRPTTDGITDTLAERALAARVNEGKSKGKRYRPKVIAAEINATRFLEHFSGDTTLYVTSNRLKNLKGGGHAFLLVIDVDDKEGLHGDVWEAAEYLNKRLGFNLAWEPSTGGRGLHGWAVHKWQGSIETYRSWSLNLKAKINEALDLEGFGCNVDIQGQPPTKDYDKRGLLIKAPRLPSLTEFEGFFSTLRFTTNSDFATFLPIPKDDDIAKLLGGGLETVDLEVEVEQPIEAEHWLDKKGKANAKSIDEGIKSEDAWKSSVYSAIKALNVYGKEATAENACEIYETEGAATDVRTQERLDRFTRILNRLRPLHDPNKKTANPNWFTSKDHAAMVNTLKPLLVDSSWADKKLVIGDLATLALLFRSSIAKYNGHVAYKGIRAFFKSVGQSMSNERIGRYRNILIDLKVISALNLVPSTAGGSGVCSSYAWLLNTQSNTQDKQEGDGKEVNPIPYTDYRFGRLDPSPKKESKENLVKNPLDSMARPRGKA